MNKILALTALSLVFFSCSKNPVYDEAPFDGKNIRIETARLTEEIPAFFTLRTDKKQVNFFVLKTAGAIQSYFDACAKCYPKKLGFRSDKDMVVCRACDVRYHINDLKDGIGSCYPIKLEGRVEGNIYIIEKNSALAGEKYF